jgi:hypothetical protein
MQGVDTELRRVEQDGKQEVRRERDGMTRQIPALLCYPYDVVQHAWLLCRYILPQTAAERYIEHLEATADSQYEFALARNPASQPQLGNIALRCNDAEQRVSMLMVMHWINVFTAREEHAIHALEQGT